jgi:hypothetical protein
MMSALKAAHGALDSMQLPRAYFPFSIWTNSGVSETLEYPELQNIS